MADKTYINTTETAKLIRTALKESFPSVKFTLNSKKYSGGSSIRVGWTDGPNNDQVNAIAGRFAGAEFDGMKDLKSYVSDTFDGKLTHFGADYVFTNRVYTDDMISRAINRVMCKFSWITENVPTPTEYRNGETWSILKKGSQGYSDNFQTEMHRELSKRSTIAQAMPSKTMERFGKR